LHIDNYEGKDFASKSRLVNDNGEAQTYNAKGGQQAKAIINTLKQPNVSRFYKGYVERLAKHREENQDHYKSLYGETSKENDPKSINKTTTGKK
jgi:hypothetical protein